MNDYYSIDQEKTSKDFCAEVIHILDRKFTKESLQKSPETSNSSQTKEVSKEEVCIPLDDADLSVLTDFIISWFGRKCECLIKSHCDKLPILIQTYLQHVPDVLVSIWRQLLQLDESSTSQEVINTRLQLLKKFQVFSFATIKCFLIHFTLYQVKKLRNLDLLEEELQYVKSEPGVHSHTLLLRNIYTFCHCARGFEMIATIFREESQLSRLPLLIVRELCTIVLYVRMHLTKSYLVDSISSLRPLVYSFLNQLSDTAIRDNKYCISQIIGSIIDPLERGPSFDLDILGLALKYICSSILILKLEGLTSLNAQLYLFLDWKAKGFLAENEHMLAKQYTNWIIDNEIVERVLGRSGQGSFHPEMLKISYVLLQFLSTNCSLTTEHVDALWEDTKDKHCSRQVFHLLSDLSKLLEEDLVNHLLGKLSDLQVEEHSVGSLQLCYALIRAHWSNIQSVGVYGKRGLGRQLPGASDNLEAMLNTSERSSSSSVASTEVQIPEDTPGQDNDLDLETIGMDTGSEEQIVINFRSDNTTPPLSEDVPVLPHDKEALPGDKSEPMERQSSDTTQSYSLDPCDPDDSVEYPIFSVAKQLPATGDNASDTATKPAKSLVQHLNTNGNSILWELLQDENIFKLTIELRELAQRQLADVIKQVRFSEVVQHFMRACLVNISQDKSVIFSLNLLLSLLSSPPSIFSGNYCAFSWAQKELNMMEVFFQNWRRFMRKVEGNEDIDLIHSTTKHLDARLEFLSTLVSNSFPSKAFTLTCEAMEEIWESLVVNTKLQLILKNKGFTWFDLQVSYMPQKIITYLVQNKISDLDPRTIPLAGFNLVRRLFPYSTPHLSCTDNPCLELVWNIAMHHFDNQISQSAIEFLNMSFFSRVDSSLSYEESFLKRSINFLAEGLDVLDTTKDISNVLSPNTFDSNQIQETNTSSAYTLVRRGLELLVSHLNLFQERFSFHLRMWRLQGKPLERHCEERFPGLTDRLGLNPPPATSSKGDCMKIYLVYTGYNDSYKTTLELSSSTLLAELRAETVFCLIKAGKTKTSSCSSEQSFSSSIPPLKLTSDGQLLQYDSDTKTLKELDIKENSILQVSHTSVPSSMPGSTVSPSLLPAPRRKSTPHSLLVELDAIPFLLRVATAVHEHGDAMSTKVWRLLAILPTSPKEMVRATSAISQDTKDWERFFGNLAEEQNLFEQLYYLQALQTVLVRAAEESAISPGVRRSGLMICVARLSTHMEFCLSVNSPASQPSSLDSIDKENVSPGTEGSVEGWGCWHQAVLCYWLEIMCVLCLHRVMLQEDSSGSDSDELILDLSQDCVVQGSSGKRVFVPRFELEMSKVTVDIIQDNSINMLSILSRALELASVANAECASILSHRAWTLLVCWCQSNRYALLDLLNRKDFSILAEKLLLHCQLHSVRRQARRSLKQLYTEFKDPVISLTLLENLLQCSIDNSTLLELSHGSPQERRDIFLNPLHSMAHPSEQLLRQSGECFQCISDLIMFVYTSKRYKKNWRCNECYEHACYERLITRAPYEIIELITDRHYNRDTMDTPDVFLKGLLQIMTALTKLSTDYTSSDQAKELVDRLLSNLFPFKSYNPSDETQSPLPVYCNPETRMNAVDLLEAMVYQNPKLFPQIAVVLRQNHPVLPGTPWEYRPRDDLRDVHTGYCGISNLGATCYMASTLQQLYMIPPLRNAILAQDPRDVTPRHSSMFRELQRLFLHLWLSRRGTYNPDKFCAEYIFDQHQLNPLEQRDMNEFFTDLLAKLEDISYLLKKTVKWLFGGVIANVVMSNECSHVSRNCEDFYSVRAKVADMPDLQASLQELTQTDVLDGDNKYTCSQCGVSVRAEKRACFAQLPSILCINTMRYTFNLSTSANEKVNTHYPFPLELDMRSFIESSNVTSYIDSSPAKSQDMDIATDPDLHCTKYVLVGVVVHTGTAEGGHYYTILQKRDNNSSPLGRWYMFNDQLVTEFDPELIGLECYGGEIPNSAVDQQTRRIFPGLLERNNSAYMLFYQRKDFRSEETMMAMNPTETARPVLLENNKFLREVYTFDLHYLQAVWKMCRHCRQDSPQLLINAVKVATQMLLATIIHAKDRPNVRKCFEWLTTQYREYPDLCTAFLEYLCLSHENNWVLEMFYLCPIKSTRDLFVSLLLTMLQSIKRNYKTTFYSGFPKVIPEGDTCNITICENPSGNSVSVAILIKNVVDLMCINELLPNSSDFSPYFEFLCHFASMGLEECQLLTTYHVVHKIDVFYARVTRQAHHPSLTFEEGILSLVYDDPSYHPDSLAHFINTLLNHLLIDKLFSKEDSSSLFHKPGFPLLTQLASSQADRQITYQIYIRIWQENISLCSSMLDALFAALSRESRHKCCNIYQLLNMVVQQDFRTMILNSMLNNIRQVFTAASLPYTLDFLSMVMLMHQPLYDWVLKQKGEWLATWLIEYEDFNVRKKTASLLYNLVPCPVFREYSMGRRQDPIKDLAASISEAGREFLYELVDELLQLLPIACETSVRCDTHDGLVQYFQVLEKCSVGESGCELIEKYFNEFWKLYHPRIATASVECHEDKSALFSYFLHTCIHCPSNIQCLIDHPTAPREISVIYILANNDKSDVVKYNSVFLEKYYTVLRLACEKSPAFVRDLSTQGNTFWALQNILPYYNLTPNAVDELYKMMNLIAKLPSAGSFRRKAISNCLDTVLPTNAKTLRKVLKSLIRCEEDAMKAFTSGGLVKLSDAYLNLFSRLNETSHVPAILTELDDLLSIVELILKTVCDSTLRGTCTKDQLNCWNESRNQFIETIAHTLNSSVSNCHRQLALQILDITIKLYPYDVANLLLPILSLKHADFYKLPNKLQVPIGPHFPRIRPNLDVPISTPETVSIQQFNMFINDARIVADYGVDPLYDHVLQEFYQPYHEIVRSICEVAITHCLFQREMIRLSCLTALEGLRLRLDVLPNLITVIRTLPQQGDTRLIESFYENPYFVELIKCMLFSYNCVLVNENLQKFCSTFYPKIKKKISSEHWISFFQTTKEEFSDLDSEPETHINAMKTLEIYLKNNSLESTPSELANTLSLYCSRHLNEEFVLCLESPKGEYEIETSQSPKDKTPERTEDQESNVKERKRPTPQNTEPTPPKRKKIDEFPNPDQNQDLSPSQQSLNALQSQTMKTLNTETNRPIEMLKLIQDLLRK